MLLYSTILNIVDTMTKENFIDAVIEWNQNNPYEENRISDIVWNGEREIRFGSDKLWLEILEYTNRNIVAVRYEKVTEDGVIWNTDYIMNFNEMRMAIRLDRSYQEEALVTNAVFSTPLFITTLIEHGYIKMDGELSVDNKPTMIGSENLELLAKAILGKIGHQMPIVFVSKTVNNENPVDVFLLASRLKGAAHIMVQEDKASNKDLRVICNGENDYNGTIGIYYPSDALGHKRLAYRDVPENERPLFEKHLLEKVISYILQYGRLQQEEVLYTWQGVNNALLNDRLKHQMEERQKAEKAKNEAEAEVEGIYDALDDDLAKLQKKVEELTKQNNALLAENNGLIGKLSQMNRLPVLYQGEEQDLYPGEILDYVLDILMEALPKIEKDTRKMDIIQDLVDNHNYQKLAEQYRTKLKEILFDYRDINAKRKQDLISLGFRISEDGKHYKLVFREDPRYTFVIPKTPSDKRSALNTIMMINRKLF